MRTLTVFVQKTHQVTDAEFDLIRSFYLCNERDRAAEFIRAQYKLATQYEAVTICDAAADQIV